MAGPNAERDAGGSQPILDLTLHLVGQLGAPGCKQLDPVVLRRVVRGGDDGSHRGPRGCGQVADATAGQHANVDRVDPHGMEPGLERRREHLAGSPGVPADYDRAAPKVGARGPADGQGELGGQFGAGDTSNTVGAEDGLPIVEKTTEI